MIKQLLSSVRAVIALTLLTCIAYPLAVTGLAQVLFPQQANGSLIHGGNQLKGSRLIAQRFTEDRYFWPRPSSADYGTVASGASNQGFLSQRLKSAVSERRQNLGKNAPADLLYASGSGLDPHISPEAARFQLSRVADARRLPAATVVEVVERSVEYPQLGFLGQPRVNVLMLNLQLDELRSSGE